MTKREIIEFALENPSEFNEATAEIQTTRNNTTTIKENCRAGAIFDATFSGCTVRFIVAEIGDKYSLLGLHGSTFAAWCPNGEGYTLTFEKLVVYLSINKALYVGMHPMLTMEKTVLDSI